MKSKRTYFNNALLDDIVKDKDGKEYKIPDRWKKLQTESTLQDLADHFNEKR